MYYSVNLVVQQDRFLRQVTDQEIVVRCYLQENALTLKSEPMFLALKNEVNHEEMKENRYLLNTVCKLTTVYILVSLTERRWQHIRSLCFNKK